MRYPKEAIAFEHINHGLCEGVEIGGPLKCDLLTIQFVYGHPYKDRSAPWWVISSDSVKPLTPAAREFLKAAKAGR